MIKRPPTHTTIKQLIFDSRVKIDYIPEWIGECVNLKILKCENNNLLSLPNNLPPSLRFLHINNNKITSIKDKNLPSSLEYLECSHNLLTSLPENLPTSLVGLDCSYNQIITLPRNFPNGLTILTCGHNRLTSLPENLPNSLEGLNCSNNQITSLPGNLPNFLTVSNFSNNQINNIPERLFNDYLEVLDCSYNRLTSLPSFLPLFLNDLDCSNNRLTSLPEILPSALNVVNCSDNRLTSLPKNLPESLGGLDCSYNEITSLPENLPESLSVLDCSYNEITSLPKKFPTSLSDLNCENNPLECIDPDIIKKIKVFKYDNGIQECEKDEKFTFQPTYTFGEDFSLPIILEDVDDVINGDFGVNIDIREHMKENPNSIFILTPIINPRRQLTSKILKYKINLFDKDDLLTIGNDDTNRFVECLGRDFSDGSRGMRFTDDSIQVVSIPTSTGKFSVILSDYEKNKRKIKNIYFIAILPTEKVLTHTASFDVAYKGGTYVSSDHCQGGTEKKVFRMIEINPKISSGSLSKI